jgi:threonine-phosphate decarboxylase
MTAHGGDVWQAGEAFGISPLSLLDFSANINPRGLPQRARQRLERDAADPHLLSLYPDPSGQRLRRALSAQLDVPPEAILLGSGAEALLSPLFRFLRPASALVPVPAFSEYRRVCESEQIEFAPLHLQAREQFLAPVRAICRRIEAGEAPLVLLNNPHNPTGALLQAEEVRSIADAARAAGATLLLDEAFIDYVPAASLAHEAATASGLIVLRSLTKFYGCPALRIGYAVAPPGTIRAIRTLLPTWAITQFAMDALAEAVADRGYVAASLAANEAARTRLAEALSGLGVCVFPSAANFLLIELRAGMPASANLRARMLANHRILIRNCDSFEALAPGRFVRVAVRSDEDNRRLLDAFAVELNSP